LLYDIIKINGKKILSESKENPFWKD
jgi:hypothetical protein